MKNKGQEDVEARIRKWEAKGKAREEITWGMMCDGFRSIHGIPDEFQSAEDPSDRIRLWEELNQNTEPKYSCYGDDEPFYKD